MKTSNHLKWKLARKLISLSVRLVPASCNEWANAMYSELEYQEDEKKALQWATGCVMAGMILRIEKMIKGNLKISRWIFGIELIACLFPLTYVWLESLYWLSMVNFDNFGYWETAFRPPTPYIVMNFATIILGTLGPLGLILGFRAIILETGFANKVTQTILLTGTLILGVIHAVCWVLMGIETSFDYWSITFMISVLPAIVVLHLGYNYPPQLDNPVT